MRAWWVVGSAADSVARTAHAAVGHVTQVGDGKAVLHVRDVAGLSQHVADAVIAVRDVVSGRSTRTGILHAGQAVQVVVGENLSVQTRGGFGKSGQAASILDALDVRSRVESVLEVDQASAS